MKMILGKCIISSKIISVIRVLFTILKAKFIVLHNIFSDDLIDCMIEANRSPNITLHIAILLSGYM